MSVSPGEHRLTCPQTKEAAEGDDVIIRCGLDPPVDLSDSTLDVARLDLGDDDGDVHCYRRGKDQQDDQMDRYRDRTTLNHEDLIRGIVTLKISSVTLSDSGPYKVYIKKLRAHSVINISVVSGTKRNDSSTSGPPMGEETEHRGGSAKKTSVWKIVVPIVCVAAVVAAAAAAAVIWKKRKAAETSGTMKYQRPEEDAL
ncbi:hypothetical protein PFLUV_G00002590 [Perca fluviatilis]|uniref:Immunoglobulin domain-containing protein n=1 Tax=Perca fluviatilis TaxID=8168 RepID=A0A6A5EXI3_PERFL|nr:hypothetical protein PFLUV_G00002590 [Perca fluviatilis]